MKQEKEKSWIVDKDGEGILSEHPVNWPSWGLHGVETSAQSNGCQRKWAPNTLPCRVSPGDAHTVSQNCQSGEFSQAQASFILVIAAAVFLFLGTQSSAHHSCGQIWPELVLTDKPLPAWRSHPRPSVLQLCPSSRSSCAFLYVHPRPFLVLFHWQMTPAPVKILHRHLYLASTCQRRAVTVESGGWQAPNVTWSDAQSIKKCSPIIYFWDKKIKVDQVNSELSAIGLFYLCANRIITSKNPKKDHR